MFRAFIIHLASSLKKRFAWVGYSEKESYETSFIILNPVSNPNCFEVRFQTRIVLV